MKFEVEFVSQNERASRNAADTAETLGKEAGAEISRVHASGTQSLSAILGIVLGSTVLAEVVRGIFSAAKKDRVSGTQR